MARTHRRSIKKDLHDPYNHDGVITHLKPDILKYEVKWALGSITTNKAGWISFVVLFSWAISNPIRWCCESAALNMPAKLENLAVATGLEKVSFHSNPKERQCQRLPLAISVAFGNAQTTTQLNSSHTLVK